MTGWTGRARAAGGARQAADSRQDPAKTHGLQAQAAPFFRKLLDIVHFPSNIKNGSQLPALDFV